MTVSVPRCKAFAQLYPETREKPEQAKRYCTCLTPEAIQSEEFRDCMRSRERAGGFAAPPP